ncbi:hypothetical protein ZIOFF_001907 [Zingiber officinale]|uniref:Uncharacterized protein n=1 Tax=Zingiber officinale TaxID=94328 RepID=A0A8J5LYS8_ZINOF|nr:hypothetical protein ZIOFF_001907 [Zingiber officinale]
MELDWRMTTKPLCGCVLRIPTDFGSSICSWTLIVSTTKLRFGMRMEADHNLNFHYGGFFPPSLINQNVALFQPEATGLTSEGMYNSGEISSMAGMILPGNPCTQSHTSSVMSLPDNLSGSIALDPMSPVKHSATVATCWSLEELYVLRQGLMEHATEPTNIMKYIKIAAKLPEKQVRDVAMKCQLIAKEESGKRRKLENYHAEKKVQDNINLFYHVRENIDNILTSMSVNPGIISQMASLAVSIDDNLFQSILPPAIQVHVPGNTYPKEEPRYFMGGD